jgi:hypothetical protein
METILPLQTPRLIIRPLTTGPETFGIILFLAEDDEAARDLVASDPAVLKGVMLADLFPFRTALASDRLPGIV